MQYDAAQHIGAGQCAAAAAMSRQCWDAMWRRGKSPQPLQDVVWPWRVWDAQQVAEWAAKHIAKREERMRKLACRMR